MQDTCKATIARAKELCDVLSDCEDGGKCKGCGTEAKAFKEYMREMWVDDE